MESNRPAGERGIERERERGRASAVNARRCGKNEARRNRCRRCKKRKTRHGVASLSEYNKLIGGNVPRHAGNTPALLARRCMGPSSSKGRHTPFQRAFLYLYIDPLTRIRGSFKDTAMRERTCERGSRNPRRIFVLFSLRAADFRYLRDSRLFASLLRARAPPDRNPRLSRALREYVVNSLPFPTSRLIIARVGD